MTLLLNGTVATDLNAHRDNAQLTAQGFTIRHIETFHFTPSVNDTRIIWDDPELSDADISS